MNRYICNTTLTDDYDDQHWIRVSADPISDVGVDVIIHTFGATTRVNLTAQQVYELALDLLTSIGKKAAA